MVYIYKKSQQKELIYQHFLTIKPGPHELLGFSQGIDCESEVGQESGDRFKGQHVSTGHRWSPCISECVSDCGVIIILFLIIVNSEVGKLLWYY